MSDEESVLHVIKINQLQQSTDRLYKSNKPPYVQVCARCGCPYGPRTDHSASQSPRCECRFGDDEYGSIEVDYHYRREPLTLGQKLYILQKCILPHHLCEQDSEAFQTYLAQLTTDIANYDNTHQDTPIQPCPSI